MNMDEGLRRYFAARDEKRRREAERAYPAFEAAMGGFVDAHRGDQTLGGFIARLVKEMATAAYVQGVRHAGGPTPDGGEIFARALEPVRTWPDLYPAFALFDGRETNEEGEGE